MQKILEDIRKLCTPAYIYLVISAIAIVLLAFQNVGNTSEYCVGELSCKVPSTTGMFIVKIITVAFWTIVLNSLCETGYKSLSWFLVIAPFVAAAFGLFVLMKMDPLREGMGCSSEEQTPA
jgi:hypothetical protein